MAAACCQRTTTASSTSTRSSSDVSLHPAGQAEAEVQLRTAIALDASWGRRFLVLRPQELQ